MTRIRRSTSTDLVEAFLRLAVRFVDAVDADKLLHPPPKKPLPPVKLKATVVDATAEDVSKDVKP